jgi:hypothetical protein
MKQLLHRPRSLASFPPQRWPSINFARRHFRRLPVNRNYFASFGGKPTRHATPACESRWGKLNLAEARAARASTGHSLSGLCERPLSGEDDRKCAPAIAAASKRRPAASMASLPTNCRCKRLSEAALNDHFLTL